MENHFSACHEVGTALLQAVAIALDLPVETFSAYCTGQASEQRLNHYPAIRVNEMEQGTTSRIWPHADLGVLTCLFQDSVGGLEIEDRQNPGAFFPLKPSAKSEMIVNVSETLQRWTNGVLPAGIHQVTVPHNLKGEADATIPERFSCAFFVKADRTADVGALSHFIKDGEGTKYGPMTALEYHVSRVASAYS
jgi:isopenicillin N synthase-like dioxygenase